MQLMQIIIAYATAYLIQKIKFFWNILAYVDNCNFDELFGPMVYFDAVEPKVWLVIWSRNI